MCERTVQDVLEIDFPLGSLTLEAVVVDGDDLRLTLANGVEPFAVRTTPSDVSNADFIEALRSVCGGRVDLTEVEGETVLVTLERRDGEWVWDEIFGLG